MAAVFDRPHAGGAAKVRSQAQIKAPARPRNGRDAERLTVLTLIQDAKTTANVRRALSQIGIQVHEAASPANAAELLQTEADLAIVVCDLLYNDSKGPEVFHALRQAMPARDIAVVFLAAAASINDVISALRIEAIDVLRSPPEEAALVRAVRRAQAKLMRRARRQIAVRQAAEIMDAGRSLLSHLSDSLQQSHADPLWLEDQDAPEFAAPVDVPVGSEMTAVALAAKHKRLVTQHILARSARRGIFGASIAENPCWDMLLDLFDKSLVEHRVSVTSICLASGVPATTALRRLDELLEMGLVRRIKDENDARRILIALTPEGERRLKSYFDIVG
jgi:CheY-like chemotaxis protein/DNA-binding transcriptional ArsR family regulator